MAVEELTVPASKRNVKHCKVSGFVADLFQHVRGIQARRVNRRVPILKPDEAESQ